MSEALSINEVLKLGVAAHKRGHLKEADRYYTLVLKTDATHPAANQNMGILAIDLGELDKSIEFFETAIRAAPQKVQYKVSLIEALFRLGRVDEATRLTDEAIKSNPSSEILKSYQKRSILLKLEKQPEERTQVLVDLNKYTLSQALRFAKKQYKAGAIEKSRAIYREILAVYPGNKKAKQGILQIAQSPKREDIERLDPPDSLMNSVMKLYQGNEYELVLARVQKLLKNYQSSVLLLNIYGVSLARLGRYTEAIEYYDRAIAVEPNFAEVYNNKGNALREVGEVKEAVKIIQRAIKLNPTYVEAYYNLGLVYQKSGDNERAIKNYTKSIALKPTYIDAHFNLARAYQEIGEVEKILKHYLEVVHLNPEHVGAHINLGIEYKKQEKNSLAIKHLSQATKLAPNYGDAYYNLANAQLQKGDTVSAQENYLKAVDMDPNHAQAWNNLGVLYQNIGNREQAIICYETVIRLREDKATAHRNLSTLIKYEKDHPHLQQLLALQADPKLTDKSRCEIFFALAKAYEDMKSYREAYDFYRRANRSRRQILKYSFDNDRRIFQSLALNQAGLKKYALSSQFYTSYQPIFIVGLPRSGTTLVEQIISSHSKVSGLGELNYVHRLGFHLAHDENRLSLKSIEKLRENYFSYVSDHNPETPIITDKMPSNFMYLPLICAAFPEAKIIRVSRSMEAICWSNYTHYFSNNAHGYSYDLNDMINYYKMYKNLMSQWDEHYSDRIVDVNYEKLTETPESEIKKILELLDLEFEPDCLTPEKNPSIVKTASVDQVRRKIYTGSSKRWERYAPFLKNIFQ